MTRFEVPVGDAIYQKKLTFNFDKGDVEGRFDLVYLGQDGLKFHIGYREFAGTQIREKFSENFVFQVPENGETTIGYGAVRIKVYEVSNTEIVVGEAELVDPNKGFNRTPKSAEPAKPGEFGGGAG